MNRIAFRRRIRIVRPRFTNRFQVEYPEITVAGARLAAVLNFEKNTFLKTSKKKKLTASDTSAVLFPGSRTVEIRRASERRKNVRPSRLRPRAGWSFLHCTQGGGGVVKSYNIRPETTCNIAYCVRYHVYGLRWQFKDACVISYAHVCTDGIILLRTFRLRVKIIKTMPSPVVVMRRPTPTTRHVSS